MLNRSRQKQLTGGTQMLRLLYVAADQVDHAAFQRMIARDLLPYSCTVARSAAAARVLLDEVAFDVIVADYRLPDGTALDVRRGRADVPCIIMTDAEDEDMVIAASQAGLSSHVVRTPDRGHLAALPFAISAGLRLARAEQQLLLLGEAVQHVSDAVFVCDRFGRISFINAAFTALYGYSSDEILGQQASILVQDGSDRLDADLFDDVGGRALEVTHVHKTGRLVSGSLTRTSRGGVVRSEVMYVVRDLSERRRLEVALRSAEAACASMETLATTDGLTGLSNRRELDRQLAEELQRAARTRLPLAVLMIDADHFKKINDVHGHAAGDDVLRGLAKLLKDGLRSIDRVARYGGEELTVLLPDTGADGAMVVAERLRAEIEGTSFLVRLPEGGSTLINVTVSIGIAAQEATPMTAEVLIGLADGALYQAKRGGRNRTMAIR